MASGMALGEALDFVLGHDVPGCGDACDEQCVDLDQVEQAVAAAVVSKLVRRVAAGAAMAAAAAAAGKEGTGALSNLPVVVSVEYMGASLRQ